MIKTVFKNFVEESELFFVKKFISSETIEKEYSECLDIIYNVTGNFDSTKGIIVSNPKYGQGKSFFFDVVHHRHKRRFKRQPFVKTSANDLCRIYTTAGKDLDPEKELLKFIRCKNLFIDDIGEELKDGKERSHFGNKLNVIRFVLLERYKYWIDEEKEDWKTYGTTNLTYEQIAQNYDGRVADRLMQMCYWKEFKFLKSGSFRQIRETRKLTSQEINENWEKVEKPKDEKINEVDVVGYFNELINEPDEYFDNKDTSFWSFVKSYLKEKGLLKDEDFDQKIDEKFLDNSELLLRRDVRQSTRISMSNATRAVRSSAMDSALQSITRKRIYDAAENMVARAKFMELREKQYIFT